jgi:hypothetical protein
MLEAKVGGLQCKAAVGKKIRPYPKLKQKKAGGSASSGKAPI